MLKGKIAIWNIKRGFGFIKRDDGARDVFVHFRELIDQSRDHLPVGISVEFDVKTDERGKLYAIKIAVIGAAIVRPSPRTIAESYFR
jgi:CspA family cold shock protein